MKLPDDVDPEIRQLCEAINRLPGLATFTSCCGHGRDEILICLNARNLDDLTPLLYWVMACHSGAIGWHVRVYTDCGMSPPRFELIGPPDAYDDAARIARHLNACVAGLASAKAKALRKARGSAA